jgi:serine/threonine-protein kinase
MSTDGSKPNSGTQIAGSSSSTPEPSASASMPAAETPSLVGQVINGRYRIMRKLGEGGMGEVYAAEHVHIEKHVAIKLLKAEIVSNKEAVARFRQEARSASSIGHKNIIGIDDFDQLADGRIYLCMELLDGQPLNELIQQPLPPERLLNILIQTGHGLAAAHAKNIVHRDMKPENVFVTVGPNGEDIPKLLDFGIAKVAGNDGQNNLTRTGTIFGTPFYMAPEQALGQQIDARVDVYAMGVILYECFAGSLPFRGDSFMGILTQHITTEPEPVVQRAMKAGRSLPPGLAEVIAKAMSKDPDKRYRTMDELVNAMVEVYRGLAGAGMSTYMHAFAGNNGSGVVPIPGAPQSGPMTGQMGAMGGMPGMPHPTPPPMGMPGYPMQTPGQGMQPMPGMQPYPGQPYPGQPSAPNPAFAPDGSSVAIPKKGSKVGLIFALIAVLVVGGAIAVAVVMSGKEEGGPQVASGSSGSNGSAVTGSNGSAATGSNGSNGSATGSNGSNGSATGSNGSAATGSNGSNGSAATGSNGSAATGSNGSAATGSNGSNGSAATGSNGSDGSGSGSQVAGGSGSNGSGSETGSNGSNGSAATGSNGSAGSDGSGSGSDEVAITVRVEGKFPGASIYEGGKLIGRAPQDIEVVPGEPRKLVLRLKGYRDASITVDGKSEHEVVPMAKQVVVPPPEDPQKKFCKAHPDDPRCQMT